MTNDISTPKRLTAAARDLMTRDDGGLAGVWPRAAALLARQALETALDQLWAANPHTAALIDCPARTQLLCAFSYLDAELAGRLAWTWAALSRACHVYAYDLAPTAAELTTWLLDADQLADRIDDEVRALTPGE